MLKRFAAGRSYRWLLIAWCIVVLLWGTMPLLNHDGTVDRQAPRVLALTLFVLLMLVHGGLYVANLYPKIPPRWQPLYSIMQGTLVVTMGVLLQSWLLTALLFLLLMGEAVACLRRPRAIALTMILYLALFCLSMQWLGGEKLLRAALIVLLPLMLFIVGSIAMFLQQVRARQRAQSLVCELESAHAQLAASVARVEELTLLTERQRMARELHDTLAQGLAGVILQLEATGLHLRHQRTERAGEIVQQAQAQARATLASARCVIDDLRANTDDIIVAVQQEIDRFSLATGVECEVAIAPLSRLPRAYHDHAVRAIAEGLANVIRHAQARHVWVRVYDIANVIVIEVQDDGNGFDPLTLATQAGHYGLLGLRERARMANGDFAIVSTLGNGTRLQLRLPCNAEEICHA